MDTLSTTSVSSSTFKVPPTSSLHPKSSHNEFHQFIITKKNHILPQLLESTNKPKGSILLLSNKNTTFTSTHNNNFNIPLPLTLVSSSRRASSAIISLKQISPNKPESHSSSKSTTGYAVALLDAARCNNVVEAVESDVKRLSKWLGKEQLRSFMAEPGVGMRQKGGMLKEIMKKGMFHKYLVKLLKLLVEKNKIEIVSQVLTEFLRIFNELLLTSDGTSNRTTSSSSNTAHVMLVSAGGMKLN